MKRKRKIKSNKKFLFYVMNGGRDVQPKTPTKWNEVVPLETFKK